MNTNRTPLVIRTPGQGIEGWTFIAHVKSIEAAKRYLMRNVLSDQSLNLIKKHGFTLNVWERTDLQVELNGGPKGYIWDIGKTVKTH